MNTVQPFLAGLADFVRQFQRNPFDFLYERDLQAMLFASVFRQLEAYPVTMYGGVHPPAAYGGQTFIKTNPVKCEYPNFALFDVALIDESSVEHYDSTNWKREGWQNDRFWNQRIRAAIELKYLQLGDIPTDKAAKFEQDLRKLASYRDRNGDRPFLGIAVVFVQSAYLDSKVFFVDQPLAASERPETGIFRYVVTPTSDQWQSA